MLHTPTLSSAPLEHSAMDYAFLREEGIRHLERLAGQIWTDFNTHDPGVTILEQVCYALTDLAYRMEYPLPDLLTQAGEDTYDSLYTPAQILPSHPVTLTDWRKLIVDVEGVKNAWVEKVEDQLLPLSFEPGTNSLRLNNALPTAQPVFLKGLYRVLIETSDIQDLDADAVRQAVIQRLHAHRNLAEDFAETVVLPSQPIQVHTRIEIGPVEGVEAVLLAIYQHIAEVISPTLQFSTLSQLLDAGVAIDEIYDGPLLDHGFLDTAAVKRAKRKTALRTSDLIQAIMDVPGVQAVRYITIGSSDRHSDWLFPLDPRKTPKLSLEQSDIRLERNQLPVPIDATQVRHTYFQHLSQTAAFQVLPLAERDLTPPAGHDQHLDTYYSVQHQFPAAYGIGELGLPESAPDARKAQAKQLKAYLMFFDQLLANYFAQLAHMKDLFSFHDDRPQSYFSTMLDDPMLGLDTLRIHDPASHQQRLQAITENPYAGQAQIDTAAALRRKDHFLNHLIARFAEQFTDYSLLMYGRASSGSTDPAGQLVHDKQAFLQQYAALSRARGGAENYLAATDSNSQSGLAQRVRRKLGISDGSEEDFYLVEHILLRPMPEDMAQQAPLLTGAQSQDPYSLQVSFVFPNWPERFQDPDFRQFVENTVRAETPLHIIPYVQWLDAQAMQDFAAAYTNWIARR